MLAVLVDIFLGQLGIIFGISYVVCYKIMIWSFEPGLGQIQLKFADYKSSLASFEKVLEVHPENCESLKVRWGSHSISFVWEGAICMN